MNELPNDTDKAKVEDDVPFRQRKGSQILTGLFVLGVGAVLLLHQSGVYFPRWFLTWPTLLIALGILIGIKHRFRPGGWIPLIVVGAVFLSDAVAPELAFKKYIWPVLLMLAGLWIILRPKRHHHRFRHWQRQCHKNQHWQQQNIAATGDASDFIDSTSVFGGVKKIVLSKNFLGGDITNFMGGTEINLTQADFNGTITIDATNIFGGTKLIVPPTWDVQSDVVAIFGGVDDKRQISGEKTDPNKVLRLDGTCLFGGIEIKSF